MKLIILMLLFLAFTCCKKEELKNLNNKQIIIEELDINEWNTIARIEPEPNYDLPFADAQTNSLDTDGIFTI